MDENNKLLLAADSRAGLTPQSSQGAEENHVCSRTWRDSPAHPSPTQGSPRAITYPAGPDIVGVSHGLPLVELVHLLQLLPVHVGLRLLVGEAADGLHGRDGLLSRVVGLGQSALHILGELLQGAGGGTGSSAGAVLTSPLSPQFHQGSPNGEERWHKDRQMHAGYSTAQPPLLSDLRCFHSWARSKVRAQATPVCSHRFNVTFLPHLLAAKHSSITPTGSKASHKLLDASQGDQPGPVAMRAAPAYLVVLPIDIRHQHDDGEAHEGDQGELPGEAEHEEDHARGLHHVAQEDVDVLGDQVAHDGRVRRQAGDDVPCSNEGSGKGRAGMCHHGRSLPGCVPHPMAEPDGAPHPSSRGSEGCHRRGATLHHCGCKARQRSSDCCVHEEQEVAPEGTSCIPGSPRVAVGQQRGLWQHPVLEGSPQATHSPQPGADQSNLRTRVHY